MQRRTCRPIVLKRVERRLAVSIERHYLSIDHRFIGHRRQRLHDAGIPYVEVVVVSGAELHLASVLHSQGAVAVELNLVLDVRPFRQLLGAQQEHRFDETHETSLRFSLA